MGKTLDRDTLNKKIYDPREVIALAKAAKLAREQNAKKDGKS